MQSSFLFLRQQHHGCVVQRLLTIFLWVGTFSYESDAFCVRPHTTTTAITTATTPTRGATVVTGSLCAVSPFLVRSSSLPCLFMSSTSDPPPPEDTNSGDDDGGDDLTAAFFKAVKERGIEQVSIDDDDEDEDDDDDVDEKPEDDNELRDIPISEVNRFTGRDEGKVGKLAGNVTFTNRELYGTLKERVLESPAAFSNLVGGSDDDDDDELEMDNDDDSAAPYVYRPPSTVPDSGLTSGEVVTTVLEALNHNDEPEENAGVRLLYEYSSPSSAFRDPERALSVEEYADFLKTTEYRILLQHGPNVTVEKAEYAFNRKKSFYTMRLQPGDSVDRRQAVFVNFILSTKGSDEDDCWMIDSIIIRSDGIRRRGRR